MVPGHLVGEMVKKEVIESTIDREGMVFID